MSKSRHQKRPIGTPSESLSPFPTLVVVVVVVVVVVLPSLRGTRYWFFVLFWRTSSKLGECQTR